jgi:eukaryotic-like serine/threonine-protein kinase
MLERFGKFEFLEKIGEGGMAEVFLAKPSDASFSKLVAVKRLLPQLKDDYSFLEMFRREGSIAMRFRHPSIIAVYEMGAIDGQPYISMEYFPGKPVARVMNRLRDSGQALALLDKITIIKRIAEALHYIHEFSDYGENDAQIIHRDISPHNIMIGFNGVSKLIDFGIAHDQRQSRVHES